MGRPHCTHQSPKFHCLEMCLWATGQPLLPVFIGTWFMGSAVSVGCSLHDGQPWPMAHDRPSAPMMYHEIIGIFTGNKRNKIQQSNRTFVVTLHSKTSSKWFIVAVLSRFPASTCQLFISRLDWILLQTPTRNCKGILTT